MTTLKLFGMRVSFDEIVGNGLRRRDELYPLLANLINAEIAHRQSRSINYRIGGASFPVLKDLHSFVFADTLVDEGQIRELATGAFLDAKRNLILIGGTGTGKTHLAIAVASAVIRARACGRFFNLVDLVNQLGVVPQARSWAPSPDPAVGVQLLRSESLGEGIWHGHGRRLAALLHNEVEVRLDLARVDDREPGPRRKVSVVEHRRRRPIIVVGTEQLLAANLSNVPFVARRRCAALGGGLRALGNRHLLA
jgi:hypothetical protein